MTAAQILIPDCPIYMAVKNCSACGMIFYIPHRIERRCSDEGRKWWCPGCGHEWHYGDTNTVKLRKQLERVQREKERAHKERQWAEKETANERRRHSATKGHLTRQKRRVAGGVCPCCNRTFRQLAAHMKLKHPDYGGEGKA